MWLSTQISDTAFPFVLGSILEFNPAKGLYCWTDSILQKRIIANAIGRTLKINGAAYSIVGTYNGYPLYLGALGYVYNTADNSASGYGKLSLAPGFGLSEFHITPASGSSYYFGDEFWDASNIFSSASGNLVARGVNKGDASKNYSFSHDLPASYWQETSTAGVFEPMGSAAGNQYLGFLRLVDDKGYFYLQRFPASATAKSSFSSAAAWGGISYANGKWIIGSGSGHWEFAGELPKSSSDSAASFSRVWEDEGDDPYPFDLSLSFHRWGGDAQRSSVNTIATAVYL